MMLIVSTLSLINIYLKCLIKKLLLTIMEIKYENVMELLI